MQEHRDGDEARLGEAATIVGGVAAGPVAFGPGSKLGAYSIVRALGQGAMGAVYEGVHETLGKRAAIKVLLGAQSSNPDLRARFVREGQAAARIHHRHVVDVYDVGVSGSTPFLVMELLQGEDMASLLERECPLPLERTMDLMVPVLCALAVAHDLGVIHRDLKPSNIFLASDVSGEIIPKVVDFGISKLVNAEQAAQLTASASLLGTPYYMSPEQATSSKHIDATSDQYSVGIVMYEALSGRRPYQAESMLALLNGICTGAHTPLGELAPHIPGAVSAAVERAMSKDPAARFPSLRGLARELLPFASERTRVLYAREVGQEDRRVNAPPNDVLPLSIAAAARTTSGKENDSESRAGRFLLYGTLAFAAIAVTALAWSSRDLLSRVSKAPEAPKGSSALGSLPAERGAAPAASAVRGPRVAPCKAGDCDAGTAWCDAAGKQVACCAEGLVARSTDGVCGCPPGGSSNEALVGQGCARSSLSPSERAGRYQATIREARPVFRECYRRGLDASTFEGRLSVSFVLTPDGEVFDVRLEQSTVVNADVQRCVLEHARGLVFDPPENGRATIRIPVTLKSASE